MNISTTNKNSKMILEKSKNILNLTNKILDEQRISNDQEKIIDFSEKVIAWTDKETGLIWEIKNKNNIESIYSWSEALDYANELNKSKFCGFDTWRVPTLEELETLVSDINYNGYYIKIPLSKNTDWSYWTNDDKLKDEETSLCFYFNYKETRRESKNFKCYIRCVTGKRVDKK